MAPKLSAELFTIPLRDKYMPGDRYIVYAPIRRAAFVANAATVNRIAELQHAPETADAEFVEFLRQLEMVDAGEEVKPIKKFHGVPKPTTVTLFLTTACNLRCTYCYASAGDTPKRAMPVDIAVRGIDFIIANAVEQKCSGIEIAYHGGGEPTSNWRTLTESFEYAMSRAKTLGLSVRAALATNGVLSEEKANWIIQHLVGASVSFDGTPEVHDTHRLTIAGKGSSELVIQTLKRFDAAQFPYGLRLTVTREMISKLCDSIRFICENFETQRIQVEPAYQLGRWSDAPSAETTDFIEEYRAAQEIARSYEKELSFSGARAGTLTNHFCGITQDSFCLTADGQVSACYETFIQENKWASEFFYGKKTNAKDCGFAFNLPVLNNLREQTVDRREFCQGCFAKWSCGGDCYHKSLTVNGPGEFAGTDRCHIIRELTKDQILEKIYQSGGLFWHEENVDDSQSFGKEVLL